MAAKSESASSSFKIPRIESFRAHAVDQFDDAQAGVAEFTGHGHDRPRLHLGFFVDLAEEARVLGGVRHDHHFAVLRHPAGDALAELDAHIFQRLRSFSDRQLKIKFLLGFIQQQQRPVIRPQKLVDLLHDRAQHLVELQRRRQRLPQFLEDRHFPCFASFPGHAYISPAFHGRKLLDFVKAHESTFLRRSSKLNGVH